jgi:SAM-dependent methyltransferase
MVRFDTRSTLTRAEARDVYDGFAVTGHAGGRDASSGYGGPAVNALLAVAAFAEAKTVVDYGCGAGKLAELALGRHAHLKWRGVDQSPLMVKSAKQRLAPYGDRCQVELLERGAPRDLEAQTGSVDRFVSTYALDLMCEDDMYAVLDKAQDCLHPERGVLLLAGITWGCAWHALAIAPPCAVLHSQCGLSAPAVRARCADRLSVKTFFMTLLWELLYLFRRKVVGGCRPQHLEP